MHEGYAPGYAHDVMAMMSGRTAADRARFVLPLLRNGMRVLDVGCGPGSITIGLGAEVPGCQVLGVDREPGQLELARAALRRTRLSTVDFAAGSVYALPAASASVDVVFAHALFEHLASGADALAELYRVLRPGGLLTLSTSDWSRARLRPNTANVNAALRGHYLLRKRAGGDPFAGKRLPEQVTRAGFRDVRAHARYRPDFGYRELAKYVEARLVAALAAPGGDRDQLASAARSAWVWAQGGDGDFQQCWVEIVATK
ncbi:methyltransferase domain-containing protein [Amycolatopsis nigrescens]|uniref:methyltransferase domain-containing protein n=1 Tax=Amycolatopsis nigrescens TaxID=381445 RepID=UPI0003A380E2|nr:methyltransferase domain-containing protein [Amycolatopsis nigrescens]